MRWLEINGNSGSGKSSLMQAGLLPLIDQGWLWPRTGYAHWQRIGPMMPGERPVEMLAEHLARTFGAKMGEVVKDLQDGDDALRYWLRDRKQNDTAFLLAIDQFEELFTFADPDERRRFDRLLAAALEDADCPLFVISTVRADFLDRFARTCRGWSACATAWARHGRWRRSAPTACARSSRVRPGSPASTSSEIKEAMVAEARDEPGALPLVENALHWLWQKRTGNRLSGRLFTDQGGLAGILSRSADELLAASTSRSGTGRWSCCSGWSGWIRKGRGMPASACRSQKPIDVAGGGEAGRAVVNRLAGQRRPDGGTAEGPLRLITVTGGREKIRGGDGRWVNLIHETLIRSKGLDAAGKPQPYWPTLWTYIEKHKERAAWRERLQADTRRGWRSGRSAGYQWSHERVREAVAALRQVGPEFELSDDEREFLGPDRSGCDAGGAGTAGDDAQTPRC